MDRVNKGPFIIIPGLPDGCNNQERKLRMETNLNEVLNFLFVKKRTNPENKQPGTPLFSLQKLTRIL